MKEDRDFEQREEHFPDNMTHSIHAVAGSLTEAHHLNQAQNAQNDLMLARAENIHMHLRAGNINAEQALTLMLDIPLLDYVDDEDFGFDTMRYEMAMDVNVHHKDDSGIDTDTKVDTKASYGGGLFARLAGVKASVEATTDIKTSNHHLDEAGYHSASKLEFTMKRFPAPKGRKMVREAVRELFKLAIKQQQAQQAEQDRLMRQETGQKGVPKDLPKQDDASEQPANTSNSEIEDYGGSEEA